MRLGFDEDDGGDHRLSKESVEGVKAMGDRARFLLCFVSRPIARDKRIITVSAATILRQWGPLVR